MVNAVRIAGDLVCRLAEQPSPETTDERQGFLHPYEMSGGVAEVKLKILLRDFETANLARHAAAIERAAKACRAAHPGASIDVNIARQYRNLAEGLAREPRAVALVEESMRRLGRTPRRTIVRGGTDGSRLTELGLPTPNLSTGQHNPHSPLEWACLEEMVQAGELLVMLSRVWAE
jgi:tripeptide aminopeptidase